MIRVGVGVTGCESFYVNVLGNHWKFRWLALVAKNIHVETFTTFKF